MANQEVTPELLMEKYKAAADELNQDNKCHATEANVSWVTLSDGRIAKVTIRLEIGYQIFD